MLHIPAERVRASRSIGSVLKPGQRIVLIAHVNADGDAIGSEVGLWHLLGAHQLHPLITNPTPIPERFRFLVPNEADASARAAKEMSRADVVFLMDVADLSLIGDLAHDLRRRTGAIVCIDHHLIGRELPSGPRLIDPHATATAELVFDLAGSLGWSLTPEAARALYVGLLTDTGGFRFANTVPRALRVAAALLECGVSPESIYEQVFASAPERRIRLMTEVLQTLVIEPDLGLAWMTVPPGAIQRYTATTDDLDGVMEFARSVDVVRLVLLFRELANGRVKISYRSKNGVDAAKLAAQIEGGGGHSRAAGASVDGSIAEAHSKVLLMAREYLSKLGR